MLTSALSRPVFVLRFFGAALLAIIASLAWVAIASAGATTTLYVSAQSTDTSGSCASASQPCQINYGVSQATTPGDVVVVMPGTYDVTSPISTAAAITIEGEPGKRRPALIGASSLTAATVSATGGATIRHLGIATSKSVALSIDGGVAEDLRLYAGTAANAGAALSVKDSSSNTIVRTVLAVSQAPNGAAVAFADGTTTGTAYVLNLTAVATYASTPALSGDAVNGTILVKDSIATGPGGAVTVQPGTHPIEIGFSDIPNAGAGSYIDEGGNITAGPVFINPAHGHFRESPASPTVGAGSPDGQATDSDLDGHSWTNPPDMGAFTRASASDDDGDDQMGPGANGPTQGSQGATAPGARGGTAAGSSSGSALPQPSAPVAGVSVTLHPVAGSVEVRLPHTHTLIPLSQAAQLPVGTVIDATHGQVSLTSAVSRSGATKTGLFRGGSFVVSQPKSAHPLTNLALAGGNFAACQVKTVLLAGQGVFAAPMRSAPKVVRQLWGKDSGGKFRTVGRTASAAVRGTVWLTQDRCDGTLIRVSRGHVLVHDAARHRNVLVGPGKSYFAARVVTRPSAVKRTVLDDGQNKADGQKADAGTDGANDKTKSKGDGSDSKGDSQGDGTSSSDSSGSDAAATNPSSPASSSPASPGNPDRQGNGTGNGKANGKAKGNGKANGQTPASLPAPSPPAVGVSVTLRTASGEVEVHLPHAATSVALPPAAQLPIGTVIDATHGQVSLTSAVSSTGATKTGVFRGGSFVLAQPAAAHPYTDLKLTGGSFAACTAPLPVTHGPGVFESPFRAATASHKVVRQLWGKDSKGKFVTIGRSASATVRGTVWLTQDRCDGTLVRVFKGHVLVHDKVLNRNVLVGPGHAYLAHAAL